jgi:hypothetical protein
MVHHRRRASVHRELEGEVARTARRASPGRLPKPLRCDITSARRK